MSEEERRAAAVEVITRHLGGLDLDWLEASAVATAAQIRRDAAADARYKTLFATVCHEEGSAGE